MLLSANLKWPTWNLFHEIYVFDDGNLATLAKTGVLKTSRIVLFGIISLDDLVN